MTLALIVSAGLLAASPDAPPPEVARAYQEARARAGRSPGDQVKLALWCEAHGLTAERLNHLALAVLADPTNAAARGLMGLVALDGRFQRPEVVAARVKADPTLDEYNARRMKAPYTADGQWALGLWADEHGLKDQARAHFTAVTRLDPARDHAWQRLGYRRHGPRWLTDERAAAEKAESVAQKQADKRWHPQIDRLKAMLDNPAKRKEAETALAAITDPRAVPSIQGAFVDGRPGDQLRAVQLLGQVDAPAASRALAALAVLPKAAEVRRAAVETLRQRDPRDFVRLWIGLVRDPIKYEVKPVGKPGSPGTLLVEGQKSNLRRVYAPPPMPTVPNVPGARLSYDANGLPVVTEPIGRIAFAGMVAYLPTYTYDGPQLVAAVTQAAHGGNLQHIVAQQAATGHPAQRSTGYLPYEFSAEAVAVVMNTNGGGGVRRMEQESDIRIPIGQMMVEAQRGAEVARQQLAGDLAAIEQANASVRRSNEPVLHALQEVTGKELGDDATAWARWWTDQQGYAFQSDQTAERPTIVESVPLAFTPTAFPQIVVGPVFPTTGHSCFGAGTAVRTIAGDRAIESILAGDRVLAQDPKTGSLTYQPVVAAFHNPPAPTLRVRLGEDSVVATGIHRFWKAGHGWTMARDLKPGDPIRALGGIARVEAVEDEKVQPVFNLEVAEGHSFLVGKLGVLVHDNSLVEPNTSPFDASAVPVALKATR